MGSKPTKERESRFDQWIEDEISLYEDEWGPLNAEGQDEYREALGKTLHGAQLKAADAAGDLGDSVLAALKEISDSARDRSLREFFRRFW